MRSLPALAFSAAIALLIACGGSDPGPDQSIFTDPTLDGGGEGPGPIGDLDGGGIEAPDAGPACTPRTCAQQSVQCGPSGDGCGGVLQCGSCTPPTTCGGGGTPSTCGGAAACIPQTVANCPVNGCGVIADGCGGSVTCGSCTLPDTCGGGGVASVCGQPPCTPRSCSAIGPLACGPQSDGCGGVVTCASCTGSGVCGGDPAHPGECGIPPRPDGGAGWSCTPKTCANYVANACGRQSDGCGALTADCGSCTAPQTCGGGGVTPGVCSGTLGCVKLTTADCSSRGIQCGPMADGCGGTVACGSCAAGQQCGSPSTASVCYTPPAACVPRTCAQAGMNCGFVGNGCGSLLNCWPNGASAACPVGQFCGGGGNNICGTGLSAGDAGVYVSCAGGATTVVSGKIVVGTDPTRFSTAVTADPVPNAVVYIPSGTVASLGDGAVCDTCAAPAGALAVTQSAADGTFTLSNVPAGASVPIVVQLGKWRRVKYITVTACTNNRTIDDSNGTFRLPRSNADGDTGTHVPKLAISSGMLDGIECVLRKMGLTDDQFGNGGANKRVEFYQSNGSTYNASTPGSDTLVASTAKLANYDMVLFPCEGDHYDFTPAQLKSIVDYTGGGGRVFATHYSYTALYSTYTRITPQNAAYGWGNAPQATYISPYYYGTSPNSSNTTALWDVDGSQYASATAKVDESFAKGQQFAAWLRGVGAAGGTAGNTTFTINDPRNDFTAVVAPAQRWLYTTGATSFPLHYTFNTPVNAPAANQCGRVVYSDFHVNLAGTTSGKTFPAECGDVGGKLLALTSQEKVIEYMLLDLSSCISQDSAPACVAKTCAQIGATCGPQGDGCGGQIDCGPCSNTQTCGGGSVPNQCGGGVCVAKTCANFPGTCGQQSDGCGGLTASCATCPGVPCTTKTCGDYPSSCGAQSDGCGGLTGVCGSCVWPLTCGGGGVANQCGMPDGGGCTPRTCAELGIQCGPAGDGCGNLIASCGTCPPGQGCGGGGVPGVCGGSCSPKTCAQQNIECGPAGDGCGGVLACGDCTAPLTCGGGGLPGRCGAPNCTPRTCVQMNIACGPAGDGCGGLLACGDCPPGFTCGGGGVAGQCGRGNAPR
jgi:hypothetical protein